MSIQKLSSTITTAPKPKKSKLAEKDKLYSVLVSFAKVQESIAKQKEKSLAWAKANSPEKIIISWGWEDIQAIRPTWCKKRCLEAMLGISRGLKNSMTEQGWECLGIAVDFWEGEKR